MNRSDISFFSCLSCGKDLQVEAFETNNNNEANLKTGVVYCQSCKTMYPVSEGIPFLIDCGYYIESFDTDSFFTRWKDKFPFEEYKLLKGKTDSGKFRQLEFFNDDPKTYDDKVSHSSFWRANDWNTLHRWIAEFPENSIILDMGCGTGRCTIPIAQKGRGHVIGTDISIGMLRRAILKCAEAGLDNITFFLSDAEQLPLKAGKFTAVISFGMLHHVEDPAAIIKQSRKILKEGGVFYALENNMSPLRPVFDMLMKINRLWVEEAGAHPLLKKKEVAALLKEHGLSPKIKSTIFLPPHFFNLLGFNLAKIVLYLTDFVFNCIPSVRDFGGELVIQGIKINESSVT
jgi:ubiquinone/menaquinone biosynthesis C-methylase UbiE/uncharacterized protein YbaR (Trm112 family)